MSKVKRKHRWRNRFGFGCLFVIAVIVVCIFAAHMLADQRLSAIHEKLGQPVFNSKYTTKVNHSSEQRVTPPLDIQPQNNHINQSQAACDAFIEAKKIIYHQGLNKNEKLAVEFLSFFSVRDWAQNNYRLSELETSIPPNDTLNDWQNAFDFLRAHPELVEVCLTLAELGPPPLEFQPDVEFEYQFNLFALDLKECGPILVSNALLQSLDGNHDGAINSLVAALKFADSFSEYSDLSTWLVCDNAGTAVLTALYTSEDLVLNASSIDLIECLSPKEINEHYLKTIEHNAFGRAYMLNDLQKVPTQEFILMYGPDSFDSRMEQLTFSTLLVALKSPILSPTVQIAQGDVLNTWNSIQEMSGKPYYQVAEQLNTLLNAGSSITDSLSNNKPNSILRWTQRMYIEESYFSLAQTGLAVALYHDQNGFYPNSLYDVAPLLDGKIPFDEIGGRPYGYIQTEKGFLIQADNGIWPPQSKPDTEEISLLDESRRSQ